MKKGLLCLLGEGVMVGKEGMVPVLPCKSFRPHLHLILWRRKLKSREVCDRRSPYAREVPGLFAG